MITLDVIVVCYPDGTERIFDRGDKHINFATFEGHATNISDRLQHWRSRAEKEGWGYSFRVARLCESAPKSSPAAYCAHEETEE